MSDRLNFIDARENSLPKSNGQINADLWKSMADVVTAGPEARANPFVGWNGELTEEGKRLFGLLASGADPLSALDGGKHDLKILNKRLKELKPIKEHFNNKGLAAEKEHLLGSLATSFDRDNQSILHDELRQFETRAWANSIKKDAVAETYKEISRILEATGNEPLTPELRKQVAREVIRHCSDPTIISQGNHNTCNVTAVEVRTYSLHPAKAAKLVADVATTGNYRTTTGISVRVDAESMKPDKQALASAPDRGKREYATQLFNLAAANIWYSAVKPSMHYEQRLHEAGSKQVIEERITDYSGGKPKTVLDPQSKKPIDSPFLAADQIAFISDAIVGKHEPFAVLAMQPRSIYLPGEKRESVRAANIVDEEHLPEVLETLKKEHLLPAIAHVDTEVEPLNKDAGSGAFGPGGGHVVNIFDYSGGKAPSVAMDNDWRKDDDHLDAHIRLHDMYLCMAGADAAMKDAVNIVNEAKKKGRQAPAEELASLRYKARDFSPDQYAKKAADAVAGCKATERNMSGPERTKWFDALQAIVNTVAPTDKVWLLQRVRADAVCTNAEFGKLLAGAATSISFKKRDSIDRKDTDTKHNCVRATTMLAEYLISLPSEVKKEYFASISKY